MKKSKQSGEKQKKLTKDLEKAYLRYLVPMSIDEWNTVTSLKQPTLLKQVQTKTAYSSRG